MLEEYTTSDITWQDKSDVSNELEVGVICLKAKVFTTGKKCTYFSILFWGKKKKTKTIVCDGKLIFWKIFGLKNIWLY